MFQRERGLEARQWNLLWKQIKVFHGCEKTSPKRAAEVKSNAPQRQKHRCVEMNDFPLNLTWIGYESSPFGNRHPTKPPCYPLQQKNQHSYLISQSSAEQAYHCERNKWQCTSRSVLSFFLHKTYSQMGIIHSSSPCLFRLILSTDLCLLS